MPGQQADATHRQTGDGDQHEAVQPRDAAEGEGGAGEHVGTGARGAGQQAVEENGQAGDREEVGERVLIFSS